MKWNNYHSIYFIGIGGIGMSALARYFTTIGVHVSGYDKTRTVLTNALMNEGIDIHFEDDIQKIDKNVLDDKDGSLIIFTPAIPQDHQQYNYLKDQGYTIVKRSEALGLITKGHFTIAVAGTHGKTTTSSILAYLLKESNRTFTAFLGGIATNFNSNYIHHHGEGEPVILVEADEYDRSFLRLYPNIAIVTSMDADHLDIYGEADELKNGFKEFIKNIDQNGTLIVHEKLTELQESAQCDVVSYGLNRGQFFAETTSTKDGFFIFDLYAKNSTFRSLKLGVPGFYNIENAIAALAAMDTLGSELSQLVTTLPEFSGVKRRFEFILRNEDLIFIDDYAHHPEEIRSFLTSLQKLYPEKTVTVIFQPHLFTRTRDFANAFSENLSIADEVILLDIYPAREKPIEGVNSAMLLDHINTNKKLVSKEWLLNEFSPAKGSVVATVGAGDIDKMVEPLKSKWSHA